MKIFFWLNIKKRLIVQDQIVQDEIVQDEIVQDQIVIAAGWASVFFIL